MNNAANLVPKDVKDFLVSFAAIESPPSAIVVNTAISQLSGKFKHTQPRDLSLLLSVRSRLPYVPAVWWMSWANGTFANKQGAERFCTNKRG
jgi:hypothetical protein